MNETPNELPRQVAENPTYQALVDGLMQAVGQGFDALWTRADSVQLLEGFLDGKLAIVFTRDALTIAATPDGIDTESLGRTAARALRTEVPDEPGGLADNREVADDRPEPPEIGGYL